MAISRFKVKQLLNSHTHPSDIALNHENVTIPLSTTLNDTKTKVKRQKVVEALEFTLWNDLWNKYGVFGDKKDELVGLSDKRYPRGQKVFVNFGYNIGREASMPHPAIILKNFKHLVMVVPTTTDDETDLGEIKDMLIHCPEDGNIFPNDDILELHQIRVIGKNRILSDLNKNIKDYILPNPQIDKLNGIISQRLITIGIKLGTNVITYGMDLRTILDVMIGFHHTPDTFTSLVKLQQDFNQLNKENQKLISELELLRSTTQIALNGIDDKMVD